MIEDGEPMVFVPCVKPCWADEVYGKHGHIAYAEGNDDPTPPQG